MTALQTARLRLEEYVAQVILKDAPLNALQLRSLEDEIVMAVRMERPPF